MKKLIGIICAVITVCASVAAYGATLDYTVDYDKSTITLKYSADAKYRQRVSFVLYPAADENSNPTNAADFSNFSRIAEAFANENGEAQVIFTLTEFDPAGFYIAEAQGGGYAFNTSAAKCENIEFKNKKYINEVLIPRFSKMTAADVHDEFEKEKNILALEKNERFENDRERLEALFVPCRTEDYPDGFSNIEQIMNVIDTCYLVIDLNAARDEAAVLKLIENNAAIIKTDFSDSDYKDNKAEIYKIFFAAEDFAKINSISDVEKLLNESTALAVVNKARLSSMKDAITKYASLVFGINTSEYLALCKEYGDDNVNKGFVERSFKTAQEVKQEYLQRKEKLKNPNPGTGSGGNSSSNSAQKTKTRYGEGVKAAGPNEQQAFSDVAPAHWAHEAILSMQKDKIIDGYPDGTFRPEENVTREQFIKMLLKALKITPSKKEAGFKDVEKIRWSYDYINAAKELNISNGTEEGTFLPEEVVSRQDASTMIFRALKLGDNDAWEETGENIFSDGGSISAYARRAVYALAENGIVEGMGDSTFNPHGNMTRAQAAAILRKTINFYKGQVV